MNNDGSSSRTALREKMLAGNGAVTGLPVGSTRMVMASGMLLPETHEGLDRGLLPDVRLCRVYTPRVFDDTQLVASLDFNREVVVRKAEGLTVEEATRIVTPSGVTLLGVVRHLAWVERGWFEHHLLGGPPPLPDDIDESFAVSDVASVENVIDDYQQAVEPSRVIVAQQPSFDLLSVAPHGYFGIVSLRWMLFHMNRETARHAGHLDILRELTDGATGF